MSLSNDQRLIAGTNLGVRRQGRWLVRGVDVSVRRGEIVTLIGPNGSGKTTTVRVLSGALAADEGVVERRAGLRLGYVPQRLHFDSSLPLTVERMMRLTGPLDEKAMANALARTGVSRLRKAEVARLSGGELQRVLLARAIARSPDLLVLDEPVQGVDASGELMLYDLIAQLRRETGCGVLLVSHDLRVVMAEADMVICLNGHVCCQGSPESVAASDAYARLFDPRGTLALYRHRHDHDHLPDGRVVHAHGHDHAPHDGHQHHEHDHHGYEHHHSAAASPVRPVGRSLAGEGDADVR